MQEETKLKLSLEDIYYSGPESYFFMNPDLRHEDFIMKAFHTAYHEHRTVPVRETARDIKRKQVFNGNYFEIEKNAKDYFIRKISEQWGDCLAVVNFNLHPGITALACSNGLGPSREDVRFDFIYSMVGSLILPKASLQSPGGLVAKIESSNNN